MLYSKSLLGWEEVIVKEFGVDMYTLLPIKTCFFFKKQTAQVFIECVTKEI